MIRETFKIWNEAVVSYDAGDFDTALSCLEKISEPTAKIYFDIGCVHLSKGSPNKALEIFSRTIQKDEHLAVGYFQHGIAAFKVNRITDAIDSFQKAYFYMRGHSVIDYRQLGLTVLLYSAQVLLNMALCLCRRRESAEALKWLKDAKCLDCTPILKKAISEAFQSIEKGEEFDLQQLPQSAIFRPAKSVVSNLEKRDFLGKAKVVAALDETDTFTGFVGPRKFSLDSESLISSSRQLRRQNSKSAEDLSARNPRITPRSPKSPNFRPPPPDTPPPRLPNRKYALIQSSRSTENLLSDSCMPLPNMKSYHNIKTAVQERCQDIRGFPIEAPERPPPTLKPVKHSRTDLHSEHNGRVPLKPPRQPLSDKIAFSDSTNTVSPVTRSVTGDLTKQEEYTIYRQPPSRLPPRPPPGSVQSAKMSIPSKVNKTTVALLNYDPNNERQLKFSQGEIITVVEEVGESWFQGRLRGNTGLVPWTHVQSIEQKRNIFH